MSVDHLLREDGTSRIILEDGSGLLLLESSSGATFAAWGYYYAPLEIQGVFKNVASQKATLFAFDATTGLPKAGDAANVTGYVSKDDGTVTVLGTPTPAEDDATNAKGMYTFTLTQAETNGDKLKFTAKSSTSNVVLVPAVVYTFPATGILAPATAGRTLVVDAAGLADANAVKVGPSGSGTAQTAADVGSLAAEINADVDEIITSVAAIPTVAQIATGVWQDTTAGDFTVALSVGKSLMNGVSLGTGLTVARCTLTDTLTTYTGNTVQTGDAYAYLTTNLGALGANATALASATNLAEANADLDELITGVAAIPTSNPTAAAIAAAVMADVTDTVGADVVAIKAKTDQFVFTVANKVDATATVGNVTVGGYAAGQDPATLVLAGVVNTMTVANILKYTFATTAGLLPSGAGSGTESWLGPDDATTALTFTVDASGNRTAVVRH